METVPSQIQNPNRTKKSLGIGFTRNCEKRLVFSLKLKIQNFWMKTGNWWVMFDLLVN
jgi:hypothetical protein